MDRDTITSLLAELDLNYFEFFKTAKVVYTTKAGVRNYSLKDVANFIDTQISNRESNLQAKQ